MAESSTSKGIGGRLRRASTSLVNANPQLGMWQATGTAIAQAPNLTELRVPEISDGIEFNAQGHSAQTAVREGDGDLILVKTATALGNQPTSDFSPASEAQGQTVPHPKRWQSFSEKYRDGPREKWGPTIKNGLRAFWKFFRTPSGFCIIIYFLNIVVSIQTY